MPEPILLSIATALATKAATGLYDLVKKRFSKDPEAAKALEAAEAAPEEAEPITALAERLEVAERSDPEFSRQLRAEWAQHAEGGEVVNNMTGGVANNMTGTAGKVVQARNIHGSVNL
ncbi:hypothetical protein [Amycolatopsis taiwanensis]|uniref:Uncharacterized protein n=1 Tax=Amycolatopsis taiwanensis TaxID=342230 RepID=A0A9W6R4R9_9PSEU|nr:hypothetical protein [Amycolatopsis taiwanensis]GLY67607.1 hypothetical protein Atai01_42260 [Amycolatopsis taiwanensis]